MDITWRPNAKGNTMETYCLPLINYWGLLYMPTEFL